MIKMIKPPTIINISVIRGICPANCVHCPVGKIKVDKRAELFGLGFMDVELFKKICNETLEFEYKKPLLRIHGVGEPACWKSLKEALIYAKEKGLKTWVFTMGLGKERKDFIDALKHASIVEFSINSYDSKNYKKTKGLDEKYFYEIKERIHLMHSLEKKPRLLISRVESNSPRIDEKFIKYWKKTGYADDVFIRPFHNYGQRIKDKKGILDSKEEAHYKIKSCLVPTSRMNIDGVLGIVVRCFNELFEKEEIVLKKAIGSIKNQNLTSIWNGEIMESWRKDNFSYGECKDCKSCQAPNPNSSEKQINLC